MLTKLIKYILPILILIQLYFSIQYVSSDISKGDSFILDIKGKCNENFDHKLILARKPHIAYYLNAKFILLQHSDTEEGMIKQLQEADYIYIGIIEMQTSKGKLKAIPQYAELVAYTDKSVLYKINKGGNYGQ